MAKLKPKAPKKRNPKPNCKSGRVKELTVYHNYTLPPDFGFDFDWTVKLDFSKERLDEIIERWTNFKTK